MSDKSESMEDVDVEGLPRTDLSPKKVASVVNRSPGSALGTSNSGTKAEGKQGLAASDGDEETAGAANYSNSTIVVQSNFRHLFNPKILTEGNHDVDLHSLEMKCLACLISGPIHVIYGHAADTHGVSLCIYCLSTFQQARQLQIHLVREHQSNLTVCCNVAALYRVYGSMVSLFCVECNANVDLTGSVEKDDVTIQNHKCLTDDVLCIRCARTFTLRDMASHVTTCEGPALKKGKLLQQIRIKEEPIDIVDIVSSNENSPTKMLAAIPTPSPPKPVESLRLRNRDNRCKVCSQIVTPSKTAQHALECGGRRLVKPLNLDLALSHAPSADGLHKRGESMKLQKSQQRRAPLPRVVLASNANMNGVDMKDDPEYPTEGGDTVNASCFLPSPQNDRLPHATPDRVSATAMDTALSTDTPPYSPKKFELEAAALDPETTQTKETVNSSLCDTSSIDQISGEENSYGDPVLHEKCSDKRVSLLLTELCTFLEAKHKEELRVNDNMDLRTREVCLSEPISVLSGDDILVIMITNACTGCTYCRQAKIVGVDRRQLAIHLLTRHTWSLKSADPESQQKSPEEMQTSSMINTNSTPETLPDWPQFKITLLKKVFGFSNNIFNFPSTEYFGERPCECLLCGHHINNQKSLFSHWYKSHPQTSMKCYMCHENFLFVGALFSHLCTGTPFPVIKEEEEESAGSALPNGGTEDTSNHQEDTTAMLRYQCGYCENFHLPGFFNYIVHVRTDHNTCELCLQQLVDQKELHTHILKRHRLNYYCWRCRIAYSDMNSFFGHMYWKHGNSSVLCNYCCEKKWPFIYHFCRPPSEFVCDICKEKFTRPMALKVHKRLHSGEKLRKCPKHNCHEKFISKKLLQKHVDLMHNDNPAPVAILSTPADGQQVSNAEAGEEHGQSLEGVQIAAASVAESQTRAYEAGPTGTAEISDAENDQASSLENSSNPVNTDIPNPTDGSSKDPSQNNERVDTRDGEMAAAGVTTTKSAGMYQTNTYDS